MAFVLSPPHPTLLVPGSEERVLRRPDMRHLVQPRPSGAPVYDEVDYDDLQVHRSWRTYDREDPDQVRYFMFELSQRNPGEKRFSPVFFKAHRMIRLTRVPRYLRHANGASGPDMVFEQMRDVLAALREQGILFTNTIAKSPDLPLVFAYGVQAVGSTPEEAQAAADEAFAVLDLQLAGTYQQLMYQPLTVDEAERIARYQREWQHLAMARGRPIPASGTINSSSLLDGNRTDVESAQNQLESFIRGMSDRSFMLSLVTVPISPAEIAFAWRNINQKLTEVRSETHGQRSVNAGMAFPLVLGTSASDTAGTSHSAGETYGTSSGETTGTSVAQGVTDTVGSSASDTAGTSATTTETVGSSSGATVTQGTSVSVGQSTSQTVSSSETATVGLSESVTAGQSLATSQSVTAGESLTASTSATAGQSLTASQSQTIGQSETVGASASSSLTSGSSASQSVSSGASTTSGSSVSGGIPGVTSGGQTTAETTSNEVSQSQTLTSSATNSVTNSASSTASASQTVGQSATNSVSQTVGQSATNSLSQTVGQSATNSQSATSGVSASSSSTTSVAQTVGQTVTQGQSMSQSQSVTQSQSQSQATGTSMARTLGTSQSQATSLVESSSSARSSAASEDFSSAYAVAMSRSQGTSGSLAVAPHFGVSVSRQTLDTAKQFIGDLLEAQMRRYGEGLKSGAFLYQMFLVCPDRPTLLGGAGLLKSAFWGAGRSADQLPQPFHTITEFEPEERTRLLEHALSYTSYRRREPLMELIEPFLYSSYLTPTEAAAFVHPPVVEGPGLLAVHDSMPVLRVPMDRQNRDIFLGHVVNGERGRITDIRFGMDLEETNHTLIAGVTGSGKTTTLMRFLTEAVGIEREVVLPADDLRPFPETVRRHASILALDWMRNMRDLASIPDLVASGRFRFYSILNPKLGEFRWNPLEIPAEGMTAAEWLNAQADNFTAAFNLGEFGRSLIAEFLTELYGADRLTDFVLRPEVLDEETGQILRPAAVLPAVPRDQVPASGITVDASGREIANVFSCPALSRTVSLADLAVLVAAAIERAATPEGARLMGQQMRDRLQSLWRRMQYFAPGGQYASMLGSDPDLATRRNLGVRDLLDPDSGLVTVVETDGLDFDARRLILGSVMLAIYRYGLHHGKGVFDHGGRGPGCFVVMEESHELFGVPERSEDSYSASMRTSLYEGMFRRVRALGLRLVAVAQQPASLPDAVTANINTVFIHKVRAKEDREKAFALLNWLTQLGQNLREWRYLGEMPTGYCIARLDARVDYTESAPIQFKTSMPSLREVSDQQLELLARR